MDCVDTADQRIMAALAHHRKSHWSTAQQLWVITMLLMVNPIVPQCANGIVNEDHRDDVWFQMVSRAPVGMKDRRLSQNHAIVKVKGVSARCRICSSREKESCTTWECVVCGPICKKCSQSVGIKGQTPHENFYWQPVITLQRRRNYFESRKKVVTVTGHNNKLPPKLKAP